MPHPTQSEPPGRGRRISFERVVDLIAPALGREKSEELITSAAKELGHSTQALTLEHCLALLLALGSQPGIVGVSARFARARLLSTEKRVSSKPPRRATPPPIASAAIQPAPPRAVEIQKLALDDVLNLLSQTLGSEKSREVIRAAMVDLGMPETALDISQVQALLDVTAKADGLVGIASRFAKARLILRFERAPAG